MNEPIPPGIILTHARTGMGVGQVSPQLLLATGHPGGWASVVQGAAPKIPDRVDAAAVVPKQSAPWYRRFDKR